MKSLSTLLPPIETPDTQIPTRQESSWLCEPDCPICGGQGYYRLDVPITDARFGKILVCPTASRLTIQRIKDQGKLDDRCGISPDELRNMSWSSFDRDTAGLKAAQQLKALYQKGFGMAALFGSYGLGKTLLLKVTTVVALTDGKLAAYANVSDVLDDIRLAYDSPDAMRSLVERANWWADLDVLCLDEMDKISATSWAQERLFRLLDIRYNLAIQQKALTIIAGNYTSIEQLPGYLRSRLEDNRFAGGLIYLGGRDMRKTTKPERRF